VFQKKKMVSTTSSHNHEELARAAHALAAVAYGLDSEAKEAASAAIRAVLEAFRSGMSVGHAALNASFVKKPVPVMMPYVKPTTADKEKEVLPTPSTEQSSVNPLRFTIYKTPLNTTSGTTVYAMKKTVEPAVNQGAARETMMEPAKTPSHEAVQAGFMVLKKALETAICQAAEILTDPWYDSVGSVTKESQPAEEPLAKRRIVNFPGVAESSTLSHPSCIVNYQIPLN
jgi:hypothetical protein